MPIREGIVWRLIAWRLGRLLGGNRLEAVLGDLADEYASQVDQVGRFRADVWLIAEHRSLARAYRAEQRTRPASRRTIVDALLTDLVHAWRSIRSRPSATLATLVILTLGIGLVSAMFALADPYLLRPLPFARSHELAFVALSTRDAEPTTDRLTDWQQHRSLFAGLTASGGLSDATVDVNGEEQTLEFLAVAPNYLEVLGVPGALPPDWRVSGPEAEIPVVLRAATAIELFGDDQAIGRLLPATTPGGLSYRVAGVLPDTFMFPLAYHNRVARGVVPLADDTLVTVRRSATMTSYSALNLVARLAEGVRPEAVRLALSSAPAPAPGESGNAVPATGLRVIAEDLTAAMTAGQRPMALGVLAAGVLILFACAANAANLLLTRAAYRTREFAAREALGASRWDIARLVLMELGVLAAIGIAGGLGAAAVALALVAGVIPEEYVTLGAATISWRVIAFATVAGGVVMLAGLTPAWVAWRITPSQLFNPTTSRDSQAARSLRFVMTTVQAAVAMLLIVTGAFVGRSYFTMVTQEPGYDPDLLVASMRFSFAVEDDELLRASTDLLGRLERLPGVRAAGAIHGGLVGGAGGGQPNPETTINGEPIAIVVREVSAGFFDVSGSRLIEGRLPRPDEYEQAIVVSASAAASCCAGSTVGGRTLRTRDRSYQIVGVIQDPLTMDFDEAPRPTAFLPLDRNMGFPLLNYFLRVDRTADPRLLAAIEAEILASGPQTRVQGLSTMRDRLMASVTDRAFGALMIGFFTLAGVIVSAAGLAGMVAFVVARRTREIAIRRAIGAPAANIRRVVISEAVFAAVVGSAIGLLVGGWSSRLLESLLFGVEPADPVTLGAATLGMIVLVVGAAVVPAQRALRVSPVDALRTD